MPASSNPRVFLSYQRDDVAFAEELRSWLLECGLQPWMDVHDIAAGAYWPDAIDEALQTSEIVIGILSPSSVASRNVKNEWDWALGNDRQLILLLVAPCDIPHRYYALNYLDFNASVRPSAYKQLANTLKVESAEQAPTVGGPSARPEMGSTNASTGAATPSFNSGSRLRRALTRQRATPAMVGREHEQQQLREMLDSAVSSEGGLVLIGGEAGVGKTTLVNWLQHEAQVLGAFGLAGACYDLTTTPPYGPWIEILRAFLPEDDLPPIPARIRDGTAIESFASQIALFEAVGEFFAEIAEQRPLLIVEDLHWADPASLEFLRFFSRFVGGLPVLIVATYRDDEITRQHPLFELMPRLSRESGARRLLLNRLDDDGIRAIISGRFAIRADDLDRLVDYLARLTDGNPFSVSELIKSLVEQKILSPADDRWRLGQLDDLRVPPLVREVVESRLARLDPDVREALEVAAVVGQTVPLDLWSAVTDLPNDRMIAALEQSASAMVLHDGRTQGDVVFSHALMRETIYEGIVALRRRMLHRQVGEALAATPGADPDEIAYHFRQAGDRRAINWLLRAAERAERRYSWIMASERYEAALHMLADDDRRERDRGWLLMHVGRLLRFSRRDSTLIYLEEALRIATRIGDRMLEASALWLMGITHIIDGRPVQGLAEMERALDMLKVVISDSPPAVESSSKKRTTTAEIYLMPWQIQDGALTIADVMLGWGTLAQFMASTGRFERAAEIRAKVERSKVADARRNSLPGLALELAFRGRPDEARSISSESLDYLRLLEHHVIRIANLTQYLITIYLPYFTDDVDERRRLLLSANESQESSAATVGYTPLGRGLHLVHYYNGQWKDAERLADQTLEPRAPIPGRSQYLNTYCLVRTAAEIAVDSGDLEQAGIWIDALGDWLDYTNAVLGRAEEQLLRARCHYLQGNVEEARRKADSALARASEPRQPLAQIAIHRFLGCLDTGEQDLLASGQHLDRSRRLTEDCQLPFELALTLLELARLRIATGDMDDAQHHLDEVRRICEPLGAKPTLTRVAELEAELDAGDGLDG